MAPPLPARTHQDIITPWHNSANPSNPAMRRKPDLRRFFPISTGYDNLNITLMIATLTALTTSERNSLFIGLSARPPEQMISVLVDRDEPYRKDHLTTKESPTLAT